MYDMYIYITYLYLLQLFKCPIESVSKEACLTIIFWMYLRT